MPKLSDLPEFKKKEVKKEVKTDIDTKQVKTSKKEPITPLAIKENVNFLNGQLEQLKMFGRSISLSELQDTYMKLKLYQDNLQFAVDNWLSTRKSKLGPETERKRVKMKEILEWLTQLK